MIILRDTFLSIIIFLSSNIILRSSMIILRDTFLSIIIFLSSNIILRSSMIILRDTFLSIIIFLSSIVLGVIMPRILGLIMSESDIDLYKYPL
jgi:hypothetical protein